MRKLVITTAAAAALIASGVTYSAQGAPLPKCGTPTIETGSVFAAGDTNTVTWSAVDPAGGFELVVASTGAVDGSGKLVDVERSDGSLSASTFNSTVTGLTEGTHHYQVRAKTKPQTCAAGAWSNVVATTQDQTGPAVAITSPTDGALLVAEPFTVTGTATDALSGPDEVTVWVTPAHDLAGVAVVRTATVDASSGEWSATFEGLSLGSYEIRATGTDAVGNASADPALVTVTAATI